MKRNIIIILILVVSLLIYNNKNDRIDDAIRFRVIANSNNEEDIIMKEKVVNILSKILFIDGTKNEIKNNIKSNINKIDNDIKILFDNNNYEKTYNIVYGLNEFPKKEYNGITYESGNYESLVIEIGDAKGDNYWCFLYPSLCMIDYNNEEKVIIKSKLLEIINN